MNAAIPLILQPYLPPSTGTCRSSLIHLFAPEPITPPGWYFDYTSGPYPLARIVLKNDPGSLALSGNRDHQVVFQAIQVIRQFIPLALCNIRYKQIN